MRRSMLSRVAVGLAVGLVGADVAGAGAAVVGCCAAAAAAAVVTGQRLRLFVPLVHSSGAGIYRYTHKSNANTKQIMFRKNWSQNMKRGKGRTSGGGLIDTILSYHVLYVQVVPS